MPEDKPYYYAGGDRVELDLVVEKIAVDVEAAKRAGLGEELQAVLSRGSSLRRAMILVDRAELQEGVERRLSAARALQPVFRHGETLLVALPEVRVEAPGKEAQAVRKFLTKHVPSAEIVSEKGDRLVLAPRSGKGIDALRLASQLAEAVGPTMAQPRFLRIVPRDRMPP